MYTVYAIKSYKDSRVYVGLTVDLAKRVREHNAGYVFSTKGYRPWKIIFIEPAESLSQARVREKYWKSGIGKEYLKSIPL